MGASRLYLCRPISSICVCGSTSTSYPPTQPNPKESQLLKPSDPNPQSIPVMNRYYPYPTST